MIWRRMPNRWATVAALIAVGVLAACGSEAARAPATAPPIETVAATSAAATTSRPPTTALTTTALAPTTTIHLYTVAEAQAILDEIHRHWGQAQDIFARTGTISAEVETQLKLAYSETQLEIQRDGLARTPVADIDTTASNLDQRVQSVFDQRPSCLSLNLEGEPPSQTDRAILVRTDIWRMSDFYPAQSGSEQIKGVPCEN